MPNYFVLGLLGMNAGACVTFLCQRNYAWSLVYFGAGLIQIGCLWVNR